MVKEKAVTPQSTDIVYLRTIDDLCGIGFRI